MPPIATDLAGRFTAAGFELSLIGGSLRDVLLGKSPQDVDLATDADPRQALRVVRGWADELGDSHVSSGVVEAYKGGEDDRHRVRINTRMPRTRSRVESASGGRRERGLEAHLMRSGFTVDAMALELSSTTLVDPSGGLEDLDRRVLRTPGRPADSLSADPLLMMRAAGHAARFGFEPTSELVATMTAMAKRITAVPAERVREEFSALMLAARPGDGLRLFVETGLAEHILPELPALRMESAEHHRHKDIYEHTLTVLEQAVFLETEGPDLTLRLAALLHDIGTPRTRRTGPGGRVSFHHHEVVGAKMSRRRMRALKYPAQLIEDVARLVELHLRFHGYSTQEWTDPAVRRYVRDAGPLLDRLHKLTRADCTTRNRRKAAALARAYDALEERIEHLATEDAKEALRPDLNGYQIMEILGIRRGAEVGRAYEYLRKLRMEEGPKDFEAARAALLAWRAHRNR
ncbi:CCA tRNA nucleotidyltransferase [Streptomyces sp. PKU-EA00015]|uniref:CCA tRNA nucleotidyltransferase n=1 Tax=Streptomyces sp. PKU-EA00015 TaxID=2748326 RepID=UPI0015A2A8BE|nr:CCA tRNA nucleotidyltransferase [Streptomyces sp. PKU-EA00015]